MSRDPFNSLRSRNPAPPESLPDAPMTVASAITTGHPSLRRDLAVAAVAAALVLTGGGSWLLWSRGGQQEVAIEPPAATTTTLAAPTTTPGAPVTATSVVVYFLDAEGDLVPVARDLNVLNVRPLPDLGPLTVELLLAGPGPWDAGPLPEPVGDAEAQLASAIPDRTQLLGFLVDPDAVTLDLSEQFVDAPAAAVAQLVFTATRQAGVDEARFTIEGAPYVVLADSLTLAPAAALPADARVVDTVTRSVFATFLPMVMVEGPALGDNLTLPTLITGVTTMREGTVLLQLVAEDGTLLWSAAADIPCPGCPAGNFAVEVPASAARGTGWATLRAYLSAFDRGPFVEHPVWVVPAVTPAPEGEVPEATTTTIADPAAPWSAPALAADAVPAIAVETWAAADNAAECALLFPADPATLAAGAVLHERYFGGGWGLAWDLAAGPGRWEPGGDYCPDCGREAFGVAGTGGDPEGSEDAVWPTRLQWTYGPQPGPVYAHGGYGYEGLGSGGSGEPMLAYIFIAHQGCLYNVWSFLGEEHLLALIDQLRFVEGAGAG